MGSIRAELEKAIGDPKMKVTLVQPIRPAGDAADARSQDRRPGGEAGREILSGRAAGAHHVHRPGRTASSWRRSASRPTARRASTTTWRSSAHGLNEHARVDAVYKGATSCSIVKEYANGG